MEILPTYAGMLDKKNAKQLTFIQKLQAIIELKNSIPEDEFEFIRFSERLRTPIFQTLLNTHVSKQTILFGCLY